MKPFEPRDFAEKPKKPSLNSILAQKERLKAAEEKSRAEAAGLEKDDHSPAEVAETYTPTEEKLMAEAEQMSLVGHLTELRGRIIISVLAILAGTGICYYFVEEILQFLIAPAGKLYYMRPTEAFFTYMKVAFFGGLLLAAPLVLYQVWAFVMPALTRGEKKITNWLLPVAILLFFGGICFSYFFVLPAAIRFFIGFATEDLQPLLSVGQYIDFIISFILPFGLVFELPLVVTVMAHFNLITSAFLRKQRRIFLLAAFIIGGAISPTPDVFSQSMIALPMIILYEVSLWIVGRVLKK